MVINTHEEKGQDCSYKHKTKVPLEKKESILIPLPGVNAGGAVNHHYSYADKDNGDGK